MRKMILSFALLALLFASLAEGQSRGRRRSSQEGRFGNPSAVSAPSSAPAAGRGVSFDDFRIIVTRNIFARNRYMPTQGVPFVRPTVSQERENYLVLTGVAAQGIVREAFFEDNRSGETLRVPVGSAFSAGTIVSVSFDGVVYRTGGVTRKITVGESLAGVPAGLYVPGASSQPVAAAASEPAGGPGAIEGASGGGGVLERMRQRREQEQRRLQ